MVRSHAEVRNSLVEQMHSLGLRIISSDATLESSVVRRTLPRVDDGFYGDGVAVLSDSAPASATISNMRVEDSSRAGIANFGASVSIAGTHVQCAALMLDGEIYDGYSFVFEDRGGNTCGCPIANGICKSASAGLAPPDPIQ
jgi:hypothetical protein